MTALSAGLFLLAGFKKTHNYTAGITLWAARNPWKTRFLIGGMHIILGAAGFYFGKNLAAEGVHFSYLSKDIFLATFLTSALFYPLKGSSGRSIIRQKSHDLAMILSAFLLMVNAGNLDINMRPSLTGIINVRTNAQKNAFVSGDKIQPAGQQLVIQAKQDETAAPQKEKTGKGKKIILNILVVLLSVALAFGLFMLCCGIWCNGMEVLAVLLGLVGGALLIWVLTKVLESINNPKTKSTRETVNI